VNCLFSVIVLLATAGPAPEIIAHRGESFDAPENTMAAFRLAWERKVAAIELDVHLTQDGQLICCHDPDTERIAGKKFIIKNSRFEKLRELDAGSWKGDQWKGEKMPTLDEALASIPAKGRCFIEIKVGPEAVPPVVKSIKQSGKPLEQFVIISFKADTVAESKRLLPKVEAYFLASFKQDEATGVWSPPVEDLIKQAKSIQADGLDLSFKGPLTQESVKQIKAAGLKFFVWTIDDAAIARRYAAWGADGITTNRAAWLSEQIRR
jgi:glycerophosphoryl diester phosphodiesterase